MSASESTALKRETLAQAGSATSAHRLNALIAPRAVAIVGASDRNHYAGLAIRALRGIGFDGALHLINRRGVEAFGQQTLTSIGAIGEPVDAAYLCVPIEGVLEAAEDAIAAGCRNLVIVTSGFLEVGGEGVEREEALRSLCEPTDTRVLGPNCLGFRNTLAKVALGSIPFAPQPVPGSIALISASGSVATAVNYYGIQQGIGFTHLIATGNEMNVTSADLIDYLVDVPEVRAITLFLEGVKDAAAFARAAAKAHASRKPIVVLKVGAAETTAAVAAAHTGAMVGDNRVFDAACDRLGIVRVTTIEALVSTAATLAATGPISPAGVAFLSMSGGSCEIVSDLAAATGVAFPEFADATRKKLGGVLSDLGQMHNPLDLTGAALRDVKMWRNVAELTAQDPEIGLIAINWDVPHVPEPSLPETLAMIGEAIEQSAIPALLVTNFPRPINEHGRAYLQRYNMTYALPGLGEGLAALGRLSWWSERMLRPITLKVAPDARTNDDRPTDERQALSYLAGRNVPVVPQSVVRSAEDAVAAARAFDGPVVLKILSTDIAHKSEVGGVVLDLDGDEAVAQAYRTIVESVTRHAPDASIDGVLVAPMRKGGLEMIVGVARDPLWGPVLAVGLGGVWVEALKDTALCLLPAGREEIVRALRSLRAVKLFEGFRGAPAVDLDVLADAIATIGEAVLALGPDLAALEVNPLYVRGDQVEALDALAVWSS